MTRMAEDPDEQAGPAQRGLVDREQDEDDQGDAGDAVGFESVGGGSDRVAGVVTGAVGDDAGVAGVVFLDFEDDFHEVGADVGDLGEDAAGDAEGGGAERFTDGKADEAGAGEVAGDEEQDDEHHDEFDGDEEHADAHAGLQRDVVAGIGFALEGGEGGSGCWRRC